MTKDEILKFIKENENGNFTFPLPINLDKEKLSLKWARDDYENNEKLTDEELYWCIQHGLQEVISAVEDTDAWGWYQEQHQEDVQKIINKIASKK